MLKLFGIIFIIILKFAIPVAIVFSPFAGGWVNFLLDTIDGDILLPLGLNDSIYQPIDKLADWATYVAMVVVARRFRWKINNLIYGLFAFRSIGQLAFLLTSDERVFFYFPNFLEPLFLIYATMFFFKKTKAHKTYLKHKWAIWFFVIIYKMQDEYFTHIANLDRSDFLREILRNII